MEPAVPMSNKVNKNLINLKQRQRVLQILVFSLITIMVWVGLSLFQSQKKSAIDAELKTLAKPLNPNIDIETVTNLESKKYFEEFQLRAFPIYKIIISPDGKTESKVTIDVEEETLKPSLSPRTTVAPSPTPAIAPTSQPASESGNTL